MKELLSTPFFWVMAFSVNIIFKIFVKPMIKDFVIPFLNNIMPKRIQIKTPEERRSIYWAAIVCLSFIVYWLMWKYDTVKIIEDSLIVSAAWLAIMSVLIYDVGVKFFWSILKRALQNNMEDMNE